MKIKAEKETRESKINVLLDTGAMRQFKIKTGLEFLNHMVETIAWRACINIDLNVKMSNYKLTHVIAEDSGIVLGQALNELFRKKMKQGINGSGFSVSGIDESLALAFVSIEGRSNCFIDMKDKTIYLKKVEDTLSSDLEEFLNGLAQGMKATIDIKILDGKNPHHLWEAVFRALGEALKVVFSENKWRKGKIAGVKGKL